MEVLLVANRGEIARRVFRTARSMGLDTVAVYTDPDRGSPHVAEADTAVRIDSYLDVAAVVDAAFRAGADAVHPGYGFVSERAPAAEAVVSAGLTWVGPPAAVIEALGDKVRAKELMAAAGVPLLPGATLGGDSARWSAPASEVGYPVLVKAAAGGGGRGMRLVTSPSQLAESVEGAAREAEAAFGDGTVFLERWLESPHHVEVQIVADSHGSVVHLGERECSIQRRHQKVVEEAPSPTIDDELRARLTAAAVAGARAVGYVGAGTWEFLVDGGDFFFLEVNTRLQVEHPVTEAVTGLDLVELQLLVARGDRLPISQSDVAVRGWAVEGRVVAEDPAAGWQPSTGALSRVEARPAPGLRYDLGVESGSLVVPDFDSLLGKVIAWGPDRRVAVRRLGRALDGLEIHGVATNREMLRAVTAEADFRAGRVTTGYLTEHPEVVERPAPEAIHLVAASLWTQRRRRAGATIPSGFRNLRSQDQVTAWRVGDEIVEVTYAIEGDRYRAAVGGQPRAGRIIELGDEVVDLEESGVRTRSRVHPGAGSVLVVSARAQTVCTEVPRFVDPGAAAGAGAGPAAPVPGTVVRVDVAVGEKVTAGQSLVVLEAMKLEHRIRAEADAVVAAVLVVAGDKVDAHQTLVVFEGT